VRFWPGIPALLLGLGCLALPCRAASVGDDTDKVRKEALELERSGQWARACDLYWQLLKSDRDQANLKEHYQVCVRHVQQLRRHRDPAFRQAIVHCRFAQALDVYVEVLAKVQASYVDRDKVDLPILFRYGLQELRFALEDPAFVQENLAAVDADRVRAFALRIDDWPSRLSGMDEARKQAQAVAQAALLDLGLPPAVVILELTCGACNGLDEYTAWLNPGQFREVQASLHTDSVNGAPSVEDVQLLGEGIGYCKLTTFHDSTVQELRDAILQLQTQGMRVLILDLRGNPGGLFKVAVQSSRLFLSDGVIVFTQSRLPEFNETHRSRNADALGMPLVVLVDGETASAAEVLAGALKENRRATLVGQTTFGKGSIQCVVPLEKIPAGIRITVAKFYSPANYPYSGHGVTPNNGMEFTDRTAQLNAALQEAQQLAMMLPPEP